MTTLYSTSSLRSRFVRTAIVLGEAVDGSLLEDEEDWICVEVEDCIDQVPMSNDCISIASSSGDDQLDVTTSIGRGTVTGLISWNSICLAASSSMYSRNFKTMIREMIKQPQAKPWDDVDTINPALHQAILDALDAMLQYSDDLDIARSGSIARGGAIKCSQAISRLSGLLPSNLELRNIQVGKMITFGGSAIVYKGEYSSQKVCLKVMRASGSNQEEIAKSFRQEALLWRQLHHPNILPFLGIAMDIGIERSEECSSFCLVSPWIDNGNVHNFLKRHPTCDRLKMLLEIIKGIEYLHTHNPPIVHADIRGANILVRNNDTCLLADFGVTMAIATRVPTSWRLGTGTLYWMSPEVWTHNDSYIPSRDIYAFGCTIIEIYSGKHPFPDLENTAALLDIVVKKRRKPPRPRELDEEAALWAIVDHCLTYDAERRPTATEVCHRLSTITPL